MAENTAEWEEIPNEELPPTKKPSGFEDLDIEIIDDDEPKPKEPVEEQQEEEDKNDSRFQKRIDRLTAKQREEERRRVAAEAEAQELRQRLDRLEQGAVQQQVQGFTQQYNEVKRRLRDAAEEGDTDLQVELTEQLADMRAAARIAEQQRQQQQYQQSRQQPRQQQEGGAEPPPQEALRWWNKNRWFNSPDHVEQSRVARQIDQNLEAEGWDKESKDYYDELDSRLQKRYPELYSQPTGGKPSPKPKPPTAPTGGQGGPSGKSKDGRMRFTKGQLDMAKTLGITTEEGLRLYHEELQKGER